MRDGVDEAEVDVEPLELGKLVAVNDALADEVDVAVDKRATRVIAATTRAR